MKHKSTINPPENQKFTRKSPQIHHKIHHKIPSCLLQGAACFEIGAMETTSSVASSHLRVSVPNNSFAKAWGTRRYHEKNVT